MNTLRDKTKDIKLHLENYWATLVHEERLLDIYQGQLQPYVDESIDLEYSKPETRARVKQRLPYINMCNRIVNKMSKVYVEGVNRETPNEYDQELVEVYSHCLKINERMTEANKMLNLHKRVALEPYLDKNLKPKLRVIPAPLFSVYSDDETSPNEPTIFIKFVGVIRKKHGPLTKMQDGSTIFTAPHQYRNVGKFYLYSADEFLIVDSDGDVLTEEMAMFGPGWAEGVNPLGRIPFVYIRLDEQKLIPLPDTDLYSLTILTPKLLGDLNYAVQFLSHSTMYGIDVDADNISATPDAFWILNSKDGPDKRPEIGVLNPSIDIPNVLQLIQTQLGLWLESRNIRAGALGRAEGDQPISGVAKMIDEMDTTQVRKEQVTIFENAEYDLWDLLNLMHNNIWFSVADIPYYENEVLFSDDFALDIRFPSPQPYQSDVDKLSSLEKRLNLGLMSKKMAIKELYGCESEEADEILAEIAEEGTQKAAPSLTSTDHEHAHGYIIDQFGNGNTTTTNGQVEDHVHKIIANEVLVENNHTHTISALQPEATAPQEEGVTQDEIQ